MGVKNNNENNNNNNSAVAVKLVCGDEVRRAELCAPASYAALYALIAQLFGASEREEVVVKYQDEEGDQITVSSDGELQEAVRLSKGALRLFVELKGQKSVLATAPRLQDAPLRVHASPILPYASPQGIFSPASDMSDSKDKDKKREKKEKAKKEKKDKKMKDKEGEMDETDELDDSSSSEESDKEAKKAAKAEKKAAKVEKKAAKVEKKAEKAEWKAEKKVEKEGRKAEKRAAKLAFKEHKQAIRIAIRAMRENAASQEDRMKVKEYVQQAKAELKDAGRKLRPAKKARLGVLVSDVTIPFRSELPANTLVNKTWRLKNDGEIEWPAGSKLALVRGKGIGKCEIVLQDAVVPQQEVELSVPINTPSEPGLYVACFRLATPNGMRFGRRMCVAFSVPRTGTTA